MADFNVAGAAQLDHAVQRLRAAANRSRALLQTALEEASPGLIAAARASARAVLPRRGGYGAEVAESLVTVTPIRGGGVRFRVVGRDKRLDTQGRLRHPTYGHEPWVGQQVPPGWFSKPARKYEPQFKRALDRAAERVASELDS